MPWATSWTLGSPYAHAAPPAELFATALRDGGVLEPTSYTPEPPRWTIAVGLEDGWTVILGDKQELNHRARVYAVTLDQEGNPTGVEQLHEAHVDAVLPLVYRLPGEQGIVVAAQGKSLSHEASGDWSRPVADVAVVPAETTRVRVGEEIVDLP